MSSESEQRLSMEKLKQLNAASTSAVASTSTPTPPPTPVQSPAHPTASEWEELLTMLSALYRITTTQNDLLQQIYQAIPHTPTHQLQATTKELREIRMRMEPAGKPNGKSCWLTRLRLPQIRPSLTWLLIPVILLVCWVMWHSLGTLWSAWQIRP